MDEKFSSNDKSKEESNPLPHNHFKKFLDSFTPNERSELLKQMMHHYFEGLKNLQENTIQAIIDLNKMHENFLLEVFSNFSLKSSKNAPLDSKKAILHTLKNWAEDGADSNQKYWGEYMRYMQEYKKFIQKYSDRLSPKERTGKNEEKESMKKMQKNWIEMYQASYNQWKKNLFP